MGASVEAYNGDDVVAAFADIIFEHLGDGDDAIVIEFEGQAASDRVGVGGSVVVSQSQDRRATVRIKVLRTGWENDRMQAKLEMFRQTGRFFPFLLKDTRGRELHSCAKAYIQAQPRSAHGANATDIEWVVRCPIMRSVQGGY